MYAPNKSIAASRADVETIGCKSLSAFVSADVQPGKRSCLKNKTNCSSAGSYKILACSNTRTLAVVKTSYL